MVESLHKTEEIMSKTAVITGGVGGLGHALAQALQADGWFTALIDLPSPALSNCAQGPLQRSYACDLTDAGQRHNICAQICAERPSIDLVIYNAGVTQIMPFEDADMSAHRKLFEINYFAAVGCAQAFLHPLRQSRGTHLAISSVAGFSPLLRRTSYAASKHALEGFFKSLRSEEKPHGVRTIIAAPSFVATNLGNSKIDSSGLARPGSAKDGVDYMSADTAAKTILRGVQKQRDFIAVGRMAQLAYFLNRASPRLFQTIMENKIKAEDA